MRCIVFIIPNLFGKHKRFTAFVTIATENVKLHAQIILTMRIIHHFESVLYSFRSPIAYL